MPRIARVVVLRYPHHGTQRGDRWQHPVADETGPTLPHHERTGRPLRDENFLTNLEGLLNRVLKLRMPGRKPKKQEK